MSSGRNTHGCYRCRRPVRLQGQDAVCVHCSGGFVQELDDMVSVSDKVIRSQPKVYSRENKKGAAGESSEGLGPTSPA